MIVNVPNASETNINLEVDVQHMTVFIKAVDKNRLTDYNSSVVCRIFVGDHMFQEENREDMRKMIGREIASAIIQARDIGYRQAQWDIRAALGITK